LSETTEITNIVGDLECYADELDGEGWHNAANGCRLATAEIQRLRVEIEQLRRRNAMCCARPRSEKSS
jgi:hypothetical protein